MNKAQTREVDQEPVDSKETFISKKMNAYDQKRQLGSLKSQAMRGMTEKLLQRVMSGAIYAVVITATLFFGTIPTAILIACMGWLCCSEFFHMTKISGYEASEIIGLAAAVLFPIVQLLPAIWTGATLFALVLACGIWYIISPNATSADVALTLFGPLYTSLLLSSIVHIRMSAPGYDGAFLTFAVMGSVWLTDSFAYFTGSRLGKHKMAPSISPNKTWEGFIGGLLGSAVAWIILWATGIFNIGFMYAIVCALCVALFAVIGDLFESRIKRGAHVKDSGDIMPGHGGMLDRSDSLLFGVMAADFLLHFGGVL